MIHNHWLNIKHHDSQPLAQHNSLWLNHLHSITHNQSQSLAQHYTPWFKTTGPAKRTIIHNHWLISFMTNCSAWHTITQTQSAQHKTTWFTTVWFNIAHMIHNHWLSITHHDSQPLAQHYTPWFTTTRISIAQHDSQSHAQHIVNDGVLCWVSGCELCCAMLVNHGELYWASDFESWFAMLCQWFWVMVSYAVPGVWIMVCYAEHGIVNHAVLYWSVWLNSA
jgi:hypothetical protein